MTRSSGSLVLLTRRKVATRREAGPQESEIEYFMMRRDVDGVWDNSWTRNRDEAEPLNEERVKAMLEKYKNSNYEFGTELYVPS